jgi:Anti-anti-sigma regulatory factor (antagonist of anti-sigma factor)
MAGPPDRRRGQRPVGPVRHRRRGELPAGHARAPAPFRLDRRAEGGCTVLAVTGQLDLGSSGEFGGAVGDLIAATPGLRLILDCTHLAWWDSSGWPR